VVHQVEEAGLAVVPHRDHASRDPHGRSTLERRLVGRVVLLVQRPGPVRDSEATTVRIDTALPEGVALGDRLLDRPAVGAHAARSRDQSRYALMNASRSPSMTASTLPTSIPVRWSLMS